MATYKATGSVTQNAADLLTWCAWVEKDGAVVAGTDCIVTLYQADGDGTESAVSGATETVDAPASATTNVFNGSMSVTLTTGALYYFHIDITADAANRYGTLPLTVPVRTG